jgi:hypothetical protein
MLTAMQKKLPKRPRDPNQLGRLIVALSVGEETEEPVKDTRDKAAVELGKKGGAARAASLSKKRRAEIARKAAKKRWSQK